MNDQCLKENKFRLLETRNKKLSLMSLMLKSEFLLTPLSTPSAPYVQLPSFAPIIITTTARGIVHDWQTTRNGWCRHTNKRRQRGEEGPIVHFVLQEVESCNILKLLISDKNSRKMVLTQYAYQNVLSKNFSTMTSSLHPLLQDKKKAIEIFCNIKNILYIKILYIL